MPSKKYLVAKHEAAEKLAELLKRFVAEAYSELEIVKEAKAALSAWEASK